MSLCQIHELTFGHSHGMIGGMNKTKLSIASAGVGLVVLGGATVFAMGQGAEPNQASNYLPAPETVTRVETVTEEVPVVVTEVLTKDVPSDDPKEAGFAPRETRSDNVGNPPVPPPTTQPEAPEIPPTTTAPPTTTQPPTTTTQPPVTTTDLPPTTTPSSPITTTATTPSFR